MTWILVLAAGMVLLLLSVRHVLRTAKPARREALHGAVIVFSATFLIIMAVLYHYLDTGKISMRRGVLTACNEPVGYWCCMAVGTAACTMMLAIAVSSVVRLRRPYRRYTDLVP